MRRVKAVIYGRVTGVFFRANIRDRALKLGLKGYVRNLNDKVEAVFEGRKEVVDKILDFCRKGPLMAKVDKVDVVEEGYKEEFDSFEIRH